MRENCSCLGKGNSDSPPRACHAGDAGWAGSCSCRAEHGKSCKPYRRIWILFKSNKITHFKQEGHKWLYDYEKYLGSSKDNSWEWTKRRGRLTSQEILRVVLWGEWPWFGMERHRLLGWKQQNSCVHGIGKPTMFVECQMVPYGLNTGYPRVCEERGAWEDQLETDWKRPFVFWRVWPDQQDLQAMLSNFPCLGNPNCSKHLLQDSNFISILTHYHIFTLEQPSMVISSYWRVSHNQTIQYVPLHKVIFSTSPIV